MYHANFGPDDGPLLYRDARKGLGIFLGPGAAAGRRVGRAARDGTPDGPLDGLPPAALFRLVVGDDELPGRYLLVGRRFVLGPTGPPAGPR